MLQLDCEPINGAVIELKKWNENLKLREKKVPALCVAKSCYRLRKKKNQKPVDSFLNPVGRIAVDEEATCRKLWPNLQEEGNPSVALLNLLVGFV